VFKLNIDQVTHNIPNPSNQILINIFINIYAQSVINYKNNTVTLFDQTYILITSESERNQHFYIQRTPEPIANSDQESKEKLD